MVEAAPVGRAGQNEFLQADDTLEFFWWKKYGKVFDGDPVDFDQDLLGKETYSDALRKSSRADVLGVVEMLISSRSRKAKPRRKGAKT